MKHPGLLLLAGLCVAGLIDAPVLTATSGETDVILYVGSDHKVGHPAMHLRYAGPSSNWALQLEDFWTTPQPPAPGREGGKERSITWAPVKHLGIRQGRPPGPDDEPYRRTIWRFS